MLNLEQTEQTAKTAPVPSIKPDDLYLAALALRDRALTASPEYAASINRAADWLDVQARAVLVADMNAAAAAELRLLGLAQRTERRAARRALLGWTDAATDAAFPDRAAEQDAAAALIDRAEYLGGDR